MSPTFDRVYMSISYLLAVDTIVNFFTRNDKRWKKVFIQLSLIFGSMTRLEIIFRAVRVRVGFRCIFRVYEKSTIGWIFFDFR